MARTSFLDRRPWARGAGPNEPDRVVFRCSDRQSRYAKEFLIHLGQLLDVLPLWSLEIRKTRCSIVPVSWILGKFTCLRELTLRSWSENLTDADVGHIANLQCLQYLSLDCATHLTAVGLAYLVGLSQLRELDLTRCLGVDDHVLLHLGRLTELSSLCLSFTSITDQGLRHLCHLKKLQRLVLGGNKVTKAGLAILQAALPECTVGPLPF
jgi:hypothetical protein